MSNLFFGGNQLTIMPELAMTSPAVWSSASALAREAADIILGDGLLWDRPVSGLDRTPILAKYRWGTYGFRGTEKAGNIDGVAGLSRALPHAYNLMGLDPITSSSSGISMEDRELHHAQLCCLAAILVERTVGPATTQTTLRLALQGMTERSLNIGDDSQRVVTAHSRSITVVWPVNLQWLDGHPELHTRILPGKPS